MDTPNGPEINWIAVYGAGLSTILAFLKIWEYRLGLNIKVGSGYFTDQSGANSETVFLVKATVRGKRPIKIKSWGWQLKGDGYGDVRYPYPRKSIPVELKEGNRSVIVGYPMIGFKENINIDEVIGVYMTDDAGKVWKKHLSKKKILHLLEDVGYGWILTDTTHLAHNFFWHTSTSRKRK